MNYKVIPQNGGGSSKDSDRIHHLINEIANISSKDELPVVITANIYSLAISIATCEYDSPINVNLDEKLEIVKGQLKFIIEDCFKQFDRKIEEEKEAKK